MEEIKNELVKVVVGDNSLAITQGYGYTNKDGKKRYSYNEAYYTDGDRICRKVVNERGEFYYNVELMPVVIETFIMKDGNVGSKTYPLSETPYLCEDPKNPNPTLLESYLQFKLHR